MDGANGPVLMMDGSVNELVIGPACSSVRHLHLEQQQQQGTVLQSTPSVVPACALLTNGCCVKLKTSSKRYRDKQ